MASSANRVCRGRARISKLSIEKTTGARLGACTRHLADVALKGLRLASSAAQGFAEAELAAQELSHSELALQGFRPSELASYRCHIGPAPNTRVHAT